ncbi:sugar ABC transporter substrate-binding protein [Herbiconiux moechotypicola]|uniref:D-xylose ABC transporter substrate-binding protein n=1 Tax=Herbiconiux moechotypicola TaxID=637393 RepID=A0ABN3E165_9MICO|nr:sugar ABC transporter substrate-binding protein [Herbiconiux moechotypicola]MCS5731322.1 sugar ABC transporter substrate-binding protein [Herbiconiux moechotypicola]
MFSSTTLRRATVALAAAAAASIALAGCSSGAASSTDSASGESKGALAMSFGGLDVPIWNAELVYMKELAEEAGYELLSDDPQWDVQKQIADWQAWIQRGDVKAIMGFPVQADAIVPVTAEAVAAGIPVVGYANVWEGTTGSLGSDYYADGYMVGEAAAAWINENMAGETDVPVVIMGEQTSDLGRGHAEGTRDALNELVEGGVSIAEIDAQTRDEGYSTAQSQMIAEPDTKVWLGTTDGVLLGAYQAVMDSGVAADDPTYAFGSLDATNETLDVIKIPDTIWRFGYSITAKEIAEANIKLLLQAANGEEVDDIVLTYNVVDGSNADEFYSE